MYIKTTKLLVMFINQVVFVLNQVALIILMSIKININNQIKLLCKMDKIKWISKNLIRIKIFFNFLKNILLQEEVNNQTQETQIENRMKKVLLMFFSINLRKKN